MKKSSESEGPERGGKIMRGGRLPLADRWKRRILQRHFVRMHMGLILMATTAAGLVASKGMLELGVSGVMVRYPLAVVVAYAAFLGMAGLWIWYAVSAQEQETDLGDTAADVLEEVVDGGVGWDERETARRVAYEGSSWVGSPVKGRGRSSGGSWDLSFDSDEGIWILVALAVVVLVVCGAGAYLIWAAPEILPEVAVSALLASSLRRRAQEAEAGGWMRGLVASTWAPFAVVLVTVCGLAYAVHRTCPEAVKLMEALRCAPGVE